MEWQDQVEYYLKTARQLLRTGTFRVSEYALDIALDYVEMADRIVSEIDREQVDRVARTNLM